MVPEGWKIVNLGDVVSYKKGFAFDSKNYTEFGARIIRISDTTSDGLHSERPVFIREETSDEFKDWRIFGGDIILSTVGSRPHLIESMVGKAVRVPEVMNGSLLNQNLVKLTPKADLLTPEILFPHLKSSNFITFISSLVRGNANQVSITLSDLFDFQFLLPPLAEQKRIAEVLGVWDRAIEVAGKQLDLARTQKRALMQTLLTPTRRFPGYEGQPWKDIPFNEVFDRIRRKNTVGNENVLTISGQDGLVSQSDYFNKRVAAKDLSGYTLLHGGDFAYNKSYSNGYPMGAIKVLPDEQSGVVSSLYLCFHIKDETQHSRDFYRHYFEAGRHEQEISLIAQEGARNHGLLNVGVSDFFETYLHVPYYPEQCRISEVIGAAEASEQHAQTQITCLQAEKKALMQQLLTGQKRLAV